MGVVNYSLTEQDTGLTWLDGRAIRQKSFEYLPTDHSPIQIGHGITDFDTLIDIEAVIWTTANVVDGADQILTFRSGSFPQVPTPGGFNTNLPPNSLCVDDQNIIGPSGTMPWMTQTDFDNLTPPPTIGTFRAPAVYFTLRYVCF